MELYIEKYGDHLFYVEAVIDYIINTVIIFNNGTVSPYTTQCMIPTSSAMEMVSSYTGNIVPFWNSYPLSTYYLKPECLSDLLSVASSNKFLISVVSAEYELIVDYYGDDPCFDVIISLNGWKQ